MVQMLFQHCGDKHRGIKESPQRTFADLLDLPVSGRSPCPDLSSRTWRMVSFTDSFEMGPPVRNTHIPFFFLISAVPRTGRRTTCPSELSSSRESPGASCIWSRTGLGRTTRPALSIVRVVFIMAFYHVLYHLKWYIKCRFLQKLAEKDGRLSPSLLVALDSQLAAN